MTNRCKDCARLELGLKWWFCTKDGRHIKEFDGKTYIPDTNWKGCEENFVRRDKVQYLPELYDALWESILLINRLIGAWEDGIDFGEFCDQYLKDYGNVPSGFTFEWAKLLEKVRDGK